VGAHGGLLHGTKVVDGAMAARLRPPAESDETEWRSLRPPLRVTTERRSLRPPDEMDD